MNASLIPFEFVDTDKDSTSSCSHFFGESASEAKDNLIHKSRFNSSTAQFFRAQGCFMGQFIGDAFGGLFEIESDRFLSRLHKKRIFNIFPSGILHATPGRLSSYSELAIALAGLLSEKRCYRSDEAKAAYVRWMESDPWELDNTLYSALHGSPNPNVQTSSVLSRASTLGIFHYESDIETIIEDAHIEAKITHPNSVAIQINILLTLAIAHTVRTGPSPSALYSKIKEWGELICVSDVVADAITKSEIRPPGSFHKRASWVVTAFHNTLWHLLHSNSLADAITWTIFSGGDTRSNATVCGMLLGAVHGRESLPGHWIRDLLSENRTIDPNPKDRGSGTIYAPSVALDFTKQLFGSLPHFGRLTI